MGHTTFEKEELERLVNENGYDSQNFEEEFCSLKLGYSKLSGPKEKFSSN